MVELDWEFFLFLLLGVYMFWLVHKEGFGVGLLLHERRETKASILDSSANSIVI